VLARIKQQLGQESPWLLLAVSVLVGQIGVGLYTAHEMDMPGPLWAIYYAIQLTALGIWLERDNRRLRVIRIWDIGFFLYLAWVIVIPYYLIKTRGLKRGFLIMLAWVGAYIVAYVVGLLMFV
jgi:hypothetical protein